MESTSVSIKFALLALSLTLGFIAFVLGYLYARRAGYKHPLLMGFACIIGTLLLIQQVIILLYNLGWYNP